MSVLNCEMYTEAEAARLLRLAPSTLHYWLEGDKRRGRQYQPVLRVEARSDRMVTWAEFVEAGLLRQYRRELKVPMAELRASIDLLRDGLSVPYPLASKRPYEMDRQLVLNAQDEAELDPDFCLIATVRGQLILTPPAESFLHRVTWDGELTAGWRPHDDPKSTVGMSPDVRFGKPAVNGISTQMLNEHDEAGKDEEEIAEAYGCRHQGAGCLADDGQDVGDPRVDAVPPFDEQIGGRAMTVFSALPMGASARTNARSARVPFSRRPRISRRSRSAAGSDSRDSADPGGPGSNGLIPP